MEIVNLVLREYAERKAHEATVISRVLRRKGNGTDEPGVPE